jgi:hypothetical protein
MTERFFVGTTRRFVYFFGFWRVSVNRVERILDQFVDLFKVVFFINDKEVRKSDAVALFQEFFGVREVVCSYRFYLDQIGQKI